MRTHSAESLILRTYRYGEADRIVVFLTEDRGKKRGVARNATASRRRFGAALEPLTRGRVTYVEREARDLVRLDRIEPRQMALGSVAARGGGDDGAQVLGHAAYFAELLDEWAPDGAPNERLYRLGAAVGDGLGRPGSIEALARYFEYWLLRLEGVYPAIDACARCGAPLTEGAVLVPADGAYVCDRCASSGLRVSAGALRFLTVAATQPPAEVAATPVALRILRELEQAHQRLIALHLDKELRSARVIKELRPEP
jgi:DNA repair protein RecO (recombination protein O)